MADRPRRSTRQTKAPISEPLTGPTAPRAKRKAQETDPADQLHFLLQNPKSHLTKVDISDLINSGSWNLLSQESQNALRKLLPPTAFTDYCNSAENDDSTSVNNDSMDVDLDPTRDEINHAVFSDPHFLAAIHTCQDHIYLNWMSDAHAEKLQKFQAGVQDGTMSVPWKDETWERENSVARTPTNIQTPPLRNGTECSSRAGWAAEIKLNILAKNGILRVGDVIAYKRNFTAAGLTIEKDVIIQSIHSKSYALTVLTEAGPVKNLPVPLLMREPEDPPPSTRSMIINSPAMLETGLLDIDGRMDRFQKPNGNAWKCFTIWRWRGDSMEVLTDDRGGRENHGTLFYLRGSYYHDL
ncbi:hypothetical protein BDQ12DRAFT_611005 [Crucibulum laeve]|uniref:ASX DEUBAD domain-containing protein n=1 Tax=Crucibulum laeve TaxID=68775 RepID=A0A5C3LV68_9AGAR|nr:hypothetical protein BDQ12DRAFT_611005 [Crucibulum laeve]